MIGVWTNRLKNLTHKMATEFRLPFFNGLIFFVFFHIDDQIQVIGLQPRCGHVNQKILVVEMVIEIKQPFFNSLNFFLCFLKVFFFLHWQSILSCQIATEM
jgi:hypothetical protein